MAKAKKTVATTGKSKDPTKLTAVKAGRLLAAALKTAGYRGVKPSDDGLSIKVPRTKNFVQVSLTVSYTDPGEEAEDEEVDASPEDDSAVELADSYDDLDEDEDDEIVVEVLPVGVSGVTSMLSKGSQGG